VAPELYQALDSTLAARHARDTITPRKNPEFGATMSTARLLRRLDSATRRMESRSDSLERQTPNMPAYIDTLRSLAERLEPAAFDSMSMPSSAAVGLVLGAHNLVLRHSLTPIAARGDMYAAYDNVVGRSFTISGGLTERLFPGLDLQREIQGITIARVAGKEGGRRTVVIAVRTQ
jgi:hypothetical protein